LKKVQFSSQKCNEFSGRNLIAIFETQTRKEKFSKQQKMLHYLLSDDTKNFKGSL